MSDGISVTGKIYKWNIKILRKSKLDILIKKITTTTTITTNKIGENAAKNILTWNIIHEILSETHASIFVM